MDRCHRSDRGSIPRWCSHLFFFFAHRRGARRGDAQLSIALKMKLQRSKLFPWAQFPWGRHFDNFLRVQLLHLHFSPNECWTVLFFLCCPAQDYHYGIQSFTGGSPQQPQRLFQIFRSSFFFSLRLIPTEHTLLAMAAPFNLWKNC
jgi:hypothetical protein